jgi:hypothetical protein
MPSRQQFESNEEYNKYFREYNAKNKDKIRPYKREWMRNYRKKLKEGLQKK